MVFREMTTTKKKMNYSFLGIETTLLLTDLIYVYIYTYYQSVSNCWRICFSIPM